MSAQITAFVEIVCLLDARRDEITDLLSREGDRNERLRLEGARRELTWLIEQVQEKWANSAGQGGD